MLTVSNDEDLQEERRSDEYDLEMHHSHYLMVDDGTIHNHDTKDFRTRLCSEMIHIDEENKSYSM